MQQSVGIVRFLNRLQRLQFIHTIYLHYSGQGEFRCDYEYRRFGTDAFAIVPSLQVVRTYQGHVWRRNEPMVFSTPLNDEDEEQQWLDWTEGLL